jgi:hypothetical protein
MLLYVTAGCSAQFLVGSWQDLFREILGEAAGA